MNDPFTFTVTLLSYPSHPLDNIRVMVIVWRLRGNIITVLGCVTQCSQTSAHSYEQFLQVQQIWVCHIGTLTLCIEAVA